MFVIIANAAVGAAVARNYKAFLRPNSDKQNVTATFWQRGNRFVKHGLNESSLAYAFMRTAADSALSIHACDCAQLLFDARKQGILDMLGKGTVLGGAKVELGLCAQLTRVHANCKHRVDGTYETSRIHRDV